MRPVDGVIKIIVLSEIILVEISVNVATMESLLPPDVHPEHHITLL